MQFTPRTSYAKNSFSKDNESENLEAVVKAVNGSKYPVLIGFDRTPYKEGHTVVGYGIIESGSDYLIKIWDPNYLEAPSSTLRIAKDYSGSSFDNRPVYTGQIRYALTVENTAYDYRNIQDYISGKTGVLNAMGVPAAASTAASADSGTYFMTNYSDFKVTSSKGGSATFAGGVMRSGTLDIADAWPIGDALSGLLLRFDIRDYDASAAYTVTPSSDVPSFETSMFADASSAADSHYAKITASAKGGYVFKGNGDAEAQFASPAKATVSLTYGDTKKKLYTTKVSGTDTKIGLSRSGKQNGVAAASYSGTADIAVSGDYNSVKFSGVAAGANGVHVTETDTKVALLNNGGTEIASALIGHYIEFRTFGGTIVKAIVNISPGSKAKAPMNPVRPGYVFKGWYRDTAFTKAWSFTSPVTSDMTLYAKWEKPQGGPQGKPKDISSASVTKIADRAWTGKQAKPAPVIRAGTKTLVSGTDYPLSYGANKLIGTGTVKVTGKGGYTGTKTVKFNIVPKKLSKPALKPGKRQVRAVWKKSPKAQKVTGYQIQWKKKGAKKWSKAKAVSAKKNSYIIKKLKKGAKYSVRVRAYKTVGKVKYYSAWSAVRLSGKVK
jgi:uncharacterized repeat protein (TIGR02543 family)